MHAWLNEKTSCDIFCRGFGTTKQKFITSKIIQGNHLIREVR